MPICGCADFFNTPAGCIKGSLTTTAGIFGESLKSPVQKHLIIRLDGHPPNGGRPAALTDFVRSVHAQEIP